VALTTVQSGMMDSIAQYNSFKNRIINGAMSFWQRSTTYSGTPAAGTYGSVDRWSIYSATAMAANRSTDVPSGQGFQYSLRLQRPAAATTTNAIYSFQVIESVNMLDLAGQSVTVHFWAKAGANLSSTSSQLGTGVITGTVADQGSVNALGSWTGSAVSGSLLQSLTTTWTKYSYTVTVAANALEMNLYFAFVPTGTAGADDAVYITGVQLEKGSTATAFDYRPYGTELQLCQRYYEFSGNYLLWSGYASSGVPAYYATRYCVTKRTTPTTVTLTDGGVSSFPAGAPALGTSAADGFYVQKTASATAGNAFYIFSFKADAEL
jgi:hypothetical protein